MPTPIALPGPAQRVAVGESSAYVLLEDGSVVAWGENDEGQLGNGPSGSNKPLGTYPKPSPTPVRVTDLADIIAIEAGRKHAIALRKDGTVWAWGVRDDGAIGDGDAKPAGSLRVVSATAPVAVRGLTGITQIAAGHDAQPRADTRRQGDVVGEQQRGRAGRRHTGDGLDASGGHGPGEHRRHCRGERSGYIWCVGRRASGRHALGVGQRQLGADGQRGAAIRRRTIPVAATCCRCRSRALPVRKTRPSAPDTSRRCMNDGSVRAWGMNGYGELGLGSDELVRSRARQGAWIGECRLLAPRRLQLVCDPVRRHAVDLGIRLELGPRHPVAQPRRSDATRPALTTSASARDDETFEHGGAQTRFSVAFASVAGCVCARRSAQTKGGGDAHGGVGPRL